MRRRRWLKVVVLGAALAMLPLEPASACSCAPGDLRDMYRDADGAFIGTYLERRPVDAAEPFGDAYYTFQVDEAFKGELGDTVDVRSAGNGAACGLETIEGERYGLFLQDEAGTWTSHLCNQTSPRAMRTAASPLPEPTSDGPVRLLAGGSFGTAQTIALDARGRTVGYGYGDRDVFGLDVCPGAARAVELSWRYDGRTRVTVRDLRTFDAVRTVTVPLGRRLWPRSVGCMSETGRRSVVFATDGQDDPGSVLMGIRGREVSVLRSAKGTDAAYSDHVAYIATGSHGTRIVGYDTRRDAERTLGRVPGDRVEGLGLSPDGRYLAGVSVSPLGYEDPTYHRPWVLDLETGEVRSDRYEAAAGSSAVARWWRSDRLVVVTSSGRGRVLTPSLQRVSSFAGWYGSAPVFFRGAAWGISYGTLFKLDMPSGEIERVRTLPSQTGFTLDVVG